MEFSDSWLWWIRQYASGLRRRVGDFLKSWLSRSSELNKMFISSEISLLELPPALTGGKTESIIGFNRNLLRKTSHSSKKRYIWDAMAKTKWKSQNFHNLLKWSSGSVGLIPIAREFWAVNPLFSTSPPEFPTLIRWIPPDNFPIVSIVRERR